LGQVQAPVGSKRWAWRSGSGIGSYVAAAIAQSSLSKVGIAIWVTIVLVVAVNVVFWRPLVAWAERFRFEESPARRLYRLAEGRYSL
jgi:ABC-type anion transport system duplicated permease subunit